ncbi:polyprenol reductase-like [Pollicipes pollicipes]|uniref:polyprenol reductase-like n=1 Tax=Pollicipes pollicipes TaxID=41117 RepID=UPI001884A235|nr:polyprenol reductase-like [Pollicipes pollicipes]
MCLLTTQICRRLYEHVFVHVPSNTRIHLGQYVAGVLHYVLGVAAVLAEAPGFVEDGGRGRRLFNVTKLSWLDRTCGAIFMLAWLHQYKAHCIFANLRKDESGAVVSERHAIPRGDWFEYVSCPHYLAEVVMYTCLAVILGPAHLSWLAVWFWVVSNQVGAALMSHIWYRQKFDDYPAQRRAILPYLL